ncbi:MAG: cell division protein ZapA [Bacteroidia bacterium]|nr:cell division protein ZapA [Bacteroidia bacterium]
MENKLTIKVNIVDRYYPAKIDRKDEEKIRKAAKIINEKVTLYRQKKYTDKDEQDYLAMVALQLSTRLIELEEKNNVNPVIQRVRNIDEKLREYLEKE